MAAAAWVQGARQQTIRVPDAVECRKLTVKAAPTRERPFGLSLTTREHCYAWRADLGRLTTLPAAPAAHAGGELEPAAPGPPPPAAPAAVDEEATQLPALPGGAKPKPKDQQLVLDVAGELFPDGWESISTGIIHQRVNQNLRGRNLKAVSLSTTGRALGRRRK